MKLTSVIRRGLWFGLLFACLGATRADEPVRWKFNIGERLGYHIVQELTISNVEGGVDKLQSKTHQELDVDWQVKGKKDDGEGIIAHRFDRIRSQMTLPTGHLEYDSGKEGPPAGMAAINAPLYAALVKTPIEINVSPNGVVQNVNLPPAVQTAFKKVQTAATIGDLSKADVFQTLFLPGLTFLPNGTLETGLQWSISPTADLGAGGKQTTETAFRYEGRRMVGDAEYAVIRPTRTLKFTPGENSTRTVKVQSSEGEILFDAAAGRLQSMALTYRGTIAVAVGPQVTLQKMEQLVEMKFVPPTKAEGETRRGGAGEK